MGTDTKAHSGAGALEVGDLRLLEDGSQCRGAFRSDIILPETVRDGWRQCEQACQRALTQKRTLRAAAHLRLEIIVSLRTAASVEAPSAPMLFQARL